MQKSKQTILTINEPWKLAIPQELFDSIRSVSQLTGQPTEQLIAQTIAHNWPEVRAEKKKSLASRVRLLAGDGYTFSQIAAMTGKTFWIVYKAGRSATTRPRKRISAPVKRKVIHHLRNDKLSNRELERIVGVNRETIRQWRHELQPHEAETCKPHRCPSCGGRITSPVCVVCSLVTA